MIDKLQEDINRLIALYEAVKAENASLRSSLEESRRETQAAKEQIDLKCREVENLKLMAAVAGGAKDDSDVRKKVDGLIRQIDMCIKLVEAL